MLNYWSEVGQPQTARQGNGWETVLETPIKKKGNLWGEPKLCSTATTPPPLIREAPQDRRYVICRLYSHIMCFERVISYA